MTLFVTVLPVVCFGFFSRGSFSNCYQRWPFLSQGRLHPIKVKLQPKHTRVVFCSITIFFKVVDLIFNPRLFFFIAKNEVIWWLLAARSSRCGLNTSKPSPADSDALFSRCHCQVLWLLCSLLPHCCSPSCPLSDPEPEDSSGNTGNPPSLPSLLPRTPTWSSRSVRQTFTIKAWNVLTSVSGMFLFLFFCLVSFFFFLNCAAVT